MQGWSGIPAAPPMRVSGGSVHLATAQDAHRPGLVGPVHSI